MTDNIACVSVIIPCYRCANTIGRAVTSIVSQTLKPAEIILIEDASGDETLNTLYRLQAYFSEEYIKVIVLPENVGAATARNIGWEAATQTYIAFLDSDDSWYPKKIEIQYGWMEQQPEAALTGHSCKVDELADATGVDQSIVAVRPYRVTKWSLLLSNRFQTSSVMLRRNVKFRFQEGKRYSEDFLLCLQLCITGLACYRFDENMAFLHKAEFGAGGLSGQLWKLERGELDTYFELYKQKLVGFGAFVCLACFSLMKFARRVVLTKVLRKFF